MEQKQFDELKQLQNDYRHVFSTDEGKRVLEDLKLRGFFHSSTFSPVDNQMFWNEGQRAMVLHIISMINQPFDEILKAMGEQKQEEESPLDR